MYEGLVEQFREYTVVLQPDQDTSEWWAGAPSVLRTEEGTFFLAARMREGVSPRGRRGYEVRLLESKDGLHFRPIHAIKREEVPIPGFERPALVRDPKTGKFRLYLCGPQKHGWGILKLEDADHPSRFDPATERYLTCGADGADPFPIDTGDAYAVQVEDAHRMPIEGTPECALAELSPGINLRGHPRPDAGLTCYRWLETLGADRMASIARLDPYTGRGESCAFRADGAEAVIVGVDFPILPGEGYRLSASAPGVLVLPGCIP